MARAYLEPGAHALSSDKSESVAKARGFYYDIIERRIFVSRAQREPRPYALFSDESDRAAHCGSSESTPALL